MREDFTGSVSRNEEFKAGCAGGEKGCWEQKRALRGTEWKLRAGKGGGEGKPGRTPGSTVTSEVGAAAIWMRSYLQGQATAGRVGLLRGGFQAGETERKPQTRGVDRQNPADLGTGVVRIQGLEPQLPAEGQRGSRGGKSVCLRSTPSEREAGSRAQGPQPSRAPRTSPPPSACANPPPHPGHTLPLRPVVFCVLGDTFFPLSGFRNAYFLLVGSSSS